MGCGFRRKRGEKRRLIKKAFASRGLGMANLEHVEILKQGVEVWNKWREVEQGTAPDLRNLNLSPPKALCSAFWDEEQKGANLLGINFQNTNLKKANLTNAYLREANFKGANLENSCLKSANLSGSNFEGANLWEANLTAAKIRGADLRTHLSRRIKFAWKNRGKKKGVWRKTGATHLRGANFSNAYVEEIKFNRWAFYQGIKVDSSFGSAAFRRFAQDYDYIEEFRKGSPWRFLYWPWLVSSDCGRSLSLWAVWSVIFALIFAAIFFFILEPSSFKVVGPPADSFLTMIYYSVVTFTTLGFGDITPVTTEAMLAVMVEVVLGYIMLGGLISILANKLARRS